MTIQKVLIVDDSKTELLFLTQTLEKNGFTVQTAQSGDEAMIRLSQEKPDLILMDVVMPGRNGFQLTRTIVRDPQYADLPIIICTSKTQETDRTWGLRQGARDYVTKPVNVQELLSKIRRLSAQTAVKLPTPKSCPTDKHLGICKLGLHSVCKVRAHSLNKLFLGWPCRLAVSIICCP